MRRSVVTLPEDDGLVAMTGPDGTERLVPPEALSEACRQSMQRGWATSVRDRGTGIGKTVAFKRYSMCYPHPDGTTPTFQEFRCPSA